MDKMNQDGVLLRYSVNDLIYSSRLHVARGSKLFRGSLVRPEEGTYEAI